MPVIMSLSNTTFSNKLIIYYFSGTGNAKQVAMWILDSAKTKGLETRLVNIGKGESLGNDDINEDTLIGFIYPTHGFNAPPIVLKYLWKFSESNFKNKFFVLNTRAGMKLSRVFTPGINGIALLVPTIILMLKGFNLIGYRSIDLPSNWISIHPGLKEKVIYSIFERCKRITYEFSKKILSGKKMLRGFWELPIDLTISPISVLYYLFGRFALSKTFIATNACNQCELCVVNCPVNAIYMNNNIPYWTYKCESCMRCMNHCPKRAIETPHLFVTLIWWIAFSILPLLILKFISDYIGATGFPKDIIYYAFLTFLSFVVIFGSYYIMNRLMKFRLVNRIIKYTSLTTYKFWRRYNAPKHF